MMTLIIGGSGSGKSSYAEDCVEDCAALLSTSEAEPCQKYYLATMQVPEGDGEGARKIGRHRQLRSGRGFITIEQPVDIDHAFQKMKDENAVSGTRIVLLECISNLTANEMFSGKEPGTADQVGAKIVEDTARLGQNVAHLVVVSSNVFEDGIAYDGTTMEYIRAMGIVNQKLAAMADLVVEVVVGIPVVLKG